MSKWKRISDVGMPPRSNVCYLVYCEGDGCQFTASVSKSTGEWVEWSIEACSDKIVFQDKITHWREMPKSPKD